MRDHKRSSDFIAFLDHLLETYSKGHIYGWVDNARIHTSMAVKKWLEQHPRLELVYLPTYSSHQLNPVEKVWWALKSEIAANRCFKSLADLDVAIRRFFAKFSPSDALALTNSPTVRTTLASAQY